jgi:hypothetical protein
VVVCANALEHFKPTPDVNKYLIYDHVPGVPKEKKFTATATLKSDKIKDSENDNNNEQL